jgi:hypothetical protein
MMKDAGTYHSHSRSATNRIPDVSDDTSCIRDRTCCEDAREEAADKKGRDIIRTGFADLEEYYGEESGEKDRTTADELGSGCPDEWTGHVPN